MQCTQRSEAVLSLTFLPIPSIVETCYIPFFLLAHPGYMGFLLKVLVIVL